MKNSNTNGDLPIKELIETGSVITGGIQSPIINFFTTGNSFSTLTSRHSTGLTKLFQDAGNEFKSRILSNREEMRVGAVYAYALETIDKYVNEGFQIRGDGFFEESTGQRSEAGEILEGISVVAQKEHEEKKLKFLGNLFANISINENFEKSLCNFLIKSAQKLSYRQLSVIAYYKNISDFADKTVGFVELKKAKVHRFGDKKGSFFETEFFDYDLNLELKELMQQDILVFKGCNHSSEKIKATHFALSRFGNMLFLNMELDNIEEADVLQISEMLRKCSFSSFKS